MMDQKQNTETLEGSSKAEGIILENSPLGSETGGVTNTASRGQQVKDSSCSDEEDRDSLPGFSDTESEGYYGGGSVRLSDSDSEEYAYKLSQKASLPEFHQDESMPSILQTFGLWISRSKEELKSINDQILENRLINEFSKTKLEASEEIRPNDRVQLFSGNESDHQGDQIKITESSTTQTVLIDFSSEHRMENVKGPSQHDLQNPNCNLDSQSEVSRCLSETTIEVDRIGSVIKRISEALNSGLDEGPYSIKNAIEEVLSTVNNLYRKIPGNVSLLDSLSADLKEECTKLWDTITRDLDAMQVLAESIRSNVGTA